jgi:hypothetical protein
MQQVTTSYKLTIRNQHPIVRWITRHAAYLLHRYAVHSDGQTSLQRRWGKDHKAPLCEMAETVQYMIPTLSSQPKLEPRFFKGIWLGRDTMTGESIIGTPGKIIWVRTIRRQIYPDKYDGQLLDTINVHPWTSPTPTQAIHPALLTPANPNVSTYAIGTQTVPKTTASEGTQTAASNNTLGTTNWPATARNSSSLTNKQFTASNVSFGHIAGSSSNKSCPTNATRYYYQASGYKEDSRRSNGRSREQATTNTRDNNCSTKSSRTTNTEDANTSSDSDNKERRQDHHNIL